MWRSKISSPSKSASHSTRKGVAPPFLQFSAFHYFTYVIWPNFVVAESHAVPFNLAQVMRKPFPMKSLAPLAIGLFISISPVSGYSGQLVSWGAITMPYVEPGTVFTKLSANTDHSMALAKDGTISIWGNNNTGDCDLSNAMNDVVAVASGRAESIILKKDGSITIWGDPNSPQNAMPQGLPTKYTQIAAGYDHGLALTKAGAVTAWGDDTEGQIDVPAGLTGVREILAGAENSAVILKNHTIVVWGDDSSGQDEVPSVSNIVAAAIGSVHVLAVESDGTVIGWGDDSSGEIDVPAGLKNVTAVAGGYLFSLALKKDGTVVGWGDDTYGEIDVPPGLSDVIAIAAGDTYSLALKRDGTITGWGDNTLGKTATAGLRNNVTQISSQWTDFGDANVLELRDDSTVVSIGGYGYNTVNIPTNLINVFAIADGGIHDLAVSSNSTITGWGDDESGESDTPPWVTNVDIVSLAAGEYHSLALTSFGGVFAWGDNSDGQIMVPEALFSEISAAEYHSLGITTNGQVLAWGDNSSGESTVPEGLSNVVATAAGTDHSLALLNNGTVVGWGDDSYGQLDSPAGLSNVVSIAAGAAQSLAITADSSITAWGDDSTGETDVPPSLYNAVSVAAGGDMNAGYVSYALILSGRAALENLRSNLSTFQGSLPSGTGEARSLASAVSSLSQAINPAIWTGNDSLAKRGGAAVFTQTANAIRALDQQVGNNGGNAAVFQGAINAIAQVDRLLSKAAGASTHLNANRELSNGDKSATGHNYTAAIAHYQYSWNIAVNTQK